MVVEGCVCGGGGVYFRVDCIDVGGGGVYTSE